MDALKRAAALGLAVLLAAQPAAAQVRGRAAMPVSGAVVLPAPGLSGLDLALDLQLAPAPELALDLDLGLDGGLDLPASLAAAKDVPERTPSAAARAEDLAREVSDPERPLDRAGLDRAWTGAAANGGPIVDVDPEFDPALNAERPAMHAIEIAARVGAMRPVPATRGKRDAFAWTASRALMLGASLAPYAAGDSVGIPILAAVFGAMMGLMWMVFAGMAQQAVEVDANHEFIEKMKAQEVLRKGLLEELSPIAAEMGLDWPKKLEIMPGEAANAFVGPANFFGYLFSGDYELKVTEGFLMLPASQREAILRHEFAHVRHRDAATQIADHFIVPVASMLAMLSNVPAVGAPIGEGVSMALAALPWLVYVLGKKHYEYRADQMAAHTMGSPRALASFFIEGSKDQLRAAAGTGGRLYASLEGWRRSAAVVWDWVRDLFKDHPSHERRVARLGRLGR